MYRLFKSNLAVIWLLLITGTAYAQLRSKIEHFSTEEGLSHERVTCILKDRDGFMWFGTWDGLNRFDGHTFLTYKSAPGDMSTLKNDRIDQIVEDQSNHLWLKAYDNQIYRFDKATEAFEPLNNVIFKHIKRHIAFNKIKITSTGDICLISASDGVFLFTKNDTTLTHVMWFRQNVLHKSENAITRTNYLFEDKHHNIWIGTSNGLILLKRLKDNNYAQAELHTNVAGNLNYRATDEDEQRVYFVTYSGDLVVYEKATGIFSKTKLTANNFTGLKRSHMSKVLYCTTSAGEVLTVDPSTQKVINNTKGFLGALFNLYEDREGKLWICPENRGIVLYNPLKKSFKYFKQDYETRYNRNGDHFKVFEDNNGVLWANLKGGGFGYYNPVSEKLEYFYNEPGSVNRQFSNIVVDVYYDRSGILWLNTEDRGIDKITFQRNNFEQHPLVTPSRYNGENDVRGICYDKSGRLWIGAKSGKLYIYKNGISLTGLFINEPKDGFGLVYCIMQDSRGNVWLGTKADGLYKASPEGKKFRLSHFTNDINNKESISSNEIYALLEDTRGRIWVGSYDGGLNLVTGNGSDTKFIHSGFAFNYYPKSGYRKIRHMALDSSGRIWIATTDGLLILDAVNYKYATYSKIPGDKESLGNNDIQFIFRASNKTMWLGTSGGGLVCADGPQPLEALKFKSYTTKDGLSNDYVLSCAEDKHKSLWVATLNSLSKFNTVTRTFRNYGTYDGLPKISFSEASCTSLPDNSLIFGTIKGYLSFNPDKIFTYRIPANIALTNLQVNSKDITVAADSDLLACNISYAKNLILRHDQNIFSIDYTVLDQRAGLKQTYAYRLQNFDEDWHTDRTQRRATYTNLAPGKYVFEVKTLSPDMYTNRPYRSLSITILPPPWRTWWAYIIYIVVVGFILIMVRRNALTMLHLRQNVAIEKRISELKMSFFTNVSHELRTPLTLILNPIAEIEKILNREDANYRGREYIAVVKRNADRMVRFINQLLDLRKVQSGKAMLRMSEVEIVSFTDNILSYFKDIAREKAIDVSFNPDQPAIHAWVDAEKLDIVIYNILANAFKFTSSQKVISLKLNLFDDGQWLSILVSDQGPGVPESNLEDIFELYYEGEHRRGRDYKGTGIGLALSKELIKLHNGRICAQNNNDGGLTVCIDLPVVKSHLNDPSVLFINQPVTGHKAEEVEEAVLVQTTQATNIHAPGIPLLLLVEDNTELRHFLKVQLGELYLVETAGDGAEGIRKATKLLPDLILSDVMMPIMNGIEMLDKLKNSELTSHIPVVLLSAKSSVESQIEGLRYGADHYITKPFHNEYLLACIESLLKRRRQVFEAIVEHKQPADPNQPASIITAKDELFLKQVIAVVEEKMADPEFLIDHVAEAIGMGRTTFFKKFKSLTNLAPVEFVRDMRLKRGQQCLDAGETNISIVAYTVGFNNARYFSTCFKEKYKLSPTEYIKSLKV